MVPEGGVGSCPFPDEPVRAASDSVVVWARGPDPVSFILLGCLFVLRDVASSALALAI